MDPTLLVPAALAALTLLTVGGGIAMARSKVISFAELPQELRYHYFDRGFLNVDFSEITKGPGDTYTLRFADTGRAEGWRMWNGAWHAEFR